MKAVLSCTEDDFYAFPLPIVVWSWHKIGVRSIVFCPNNIGGKIKLAQNTCDNMADFYYFDCEKRKEATYSQTSRLFGATVVDDDNEVLIVGDADLAVFGGEYKQFEDGNLRVLGYDLLDPESNQFPMCFIGMSAGKWKDVFSIRGETLQIALNDTVGNLESINFRGDFWAYDQWLAYQTINKSGEHIIKIPRAKYPERFAKMRVDRTDAYWRNNVNDRLMDAHLWRPGYTDSNFANILELLQIQYPEDNFDWLINYRNEYIKLL